MKKCQRRIPQAFVLIFVFVTLGGSQRTCRGELILTYGDSFLQSGGTGFIDVFIRSTNGSDAVQLANYTFDIITPNTGSPGILRFQSAQSKTEQNPIITGTPYFLGLDTLPNNLLATSLDARQSLTGSDSTVSLNDVTIGTSNSLLARLELEHVGAELSGVFTIRLQNSLNLSYYNSNALPNDTAFGVASYSNFGTITAVPEPSSLWLVATLLGAVACRRLRSFQSIEALG